MLTSIFSLAWTHDDDVRTTYDFHEFQLGSNKVASLRATTIPDEEAFEALKTSLDSVPSGTKMLLNSGTCAFTSISYEHVIGDENSTQG